MKVANKVIKYIREDNEATFGLDEEVSVVLMGDDVVYAGKTLVSREYTTKDGSLTIAQADDPIDWGVRLVAHPFPASARLWNGPDLLKNNKYRSMLASLFHDLIWEHADELAKAWGVTKQDVLQWGDGVLYALWMFASADSLSGRVEARLAWEVCEFSRGWYHGLKKLLGLHSILFAFLLATGCGTPPDWQVVDISGTNAVLRAMGKEQSIVQVDAKPGGQHEVESGPADSHAETSHAGQDAEGEVADLGAVEWKKCKYSSNWNGNNASKRMMNLLSPKFSDSKVKEYLDWQAGLGCDHCHLILVNGGDGEGTPYDCLADASSRATALKRVKEIRARGMGVVLWVVTDDSDAARKKIFADPAKYAAAMVDFFPYVSYITLGLEMDEGEGSSAKWKSLRDAIKKAGWTGKFATHHTSGKYTHASLGSIVCDQLDPSCTTAQVKSSVKALRSKGYEVVGFEYARGPDASRAKAALEAGAFAVGNWKGNPISTASSQEKEVDGAEADACVDSSVSASTAHGDAVDFSSLDWCWGGFNGKKATLVDGAEIGSLKVSSSGLTYKWVKGGCEKLGASSSTDHNHTICALFCRIDGRWKGGKFDWISTSRTSRDLKNVNEGYEGWDRQAVGKADMFAFVVVSADGKKRTNVITAGK